MPAAKRKAITIEDLKASLDALVVVESYGRVKRDEHGVEMTDDDGEILWDPIELRPDVLLGKDGRSLIVHNDNGAHFIDYYGEFRGGYPWVHETLEAWAKEHGTYWEWRDTGSIVCYPENTR